MKKFLMVAVLLLFAHMAIGDATDGYHIFTDEAGRAVEAKIIEFNASKGQIRLERKGGMKVWVQPNLFSEADREYIKEWIAADQVLSDNILRITLKKQKIGSFGGNRNTEQGEAVNYDVAFYNSSSTPIKDLKIEYRYYVKTIGSGDTKDEDSHVEGAIELKAIEGRQRTVLQTKELKLTEKYKLQRVQVTSAVGFGVYNTTTEQELVKLSEQKLEGIWIKVYGPPVGGVPVVRDICYPSDLMEKFAWK